MGVYRAPPPPTPPFVYRNYFQPLSTKTKIQSPQKHGLRRFGGLFGGCRGGRGSALGRGKVGTSFGRGWVGVWRSGSRGGWRGEVGPGPGAVFEVAWAGVAVPESEGVDWGWECDLGPGK